MVRGRQSIAGTEYKSILRVSNGICADVEVCVEETEVNIRETRLLSERENGK